MLFRAVLLFFQGFLPHCYIAFKRVCSCSAPLDVLLFLWTSIWLCSCLWKLTLSRLTFSSQLYSAVWRDIDLEPFGGKHGICRYSRIRSCSLLHLLELLSYLHLLTSTGCTLHHHSSALLRHFQNVTVRCQIVAKLQRIPFFESCRAEVAGAQPDLQKIWQSWKKKPGSGK